MEAARLSLVSAIDNLREMASRPDTEGLSEAGTRAVLIQPLLEALGYGNLSDIIYEYPVKVSGERIDYVLKVQGNPTIAVEAKSFSNPLSDKHAAQLVQYAAVEGIEWCVLTNAQELRIYSANIKGDLAAKHIISFDLLSDEVEEIAAALTLLTAGEMENQTHLREWMRSKLLDRALRLNLLDRSSNAVAQLANLASATVGSTVPPEDVSRWFARVLGPAPTPSPPKPPQRPAGAAPTARSFWLLPAGPAPDEAPSIESLRRWLTSNMWGMGRSTPGRKWMDEGDFVCFYATGVGVAAWAQLSAKPDSLVTLDEWPEPTPMDEEVFKVPLKEVKWLKDPTVIAEDLRAKLEAFRDKKKSPIWSWFVQTTKKLSEHDFNLLTNGREG